MRLLRENFETSAGSTAIIGTGIVEELELQTMSGLVDAASSLREMLFKIKEEENRLMAENNVVLVLGTEFPS